MFYLHLLETKMDWAILICLAYFMILL